MKTSLLNFPFCSRRNFQAVCTSAIVGLKGFSDEAIWKYARDQEFTIVSKDSDFYQRSLLYGHPPKLVWLRIGNCTRDDLTALIQNSREEIYRFIADPLGSVLSLS